MDSWAEKEALMQRNLDELEMFCKKWGLLLNVDKTKIMVLTRSKQIKGREVLLCLNDESRFEDKTSREV